MLNVPKGVLDDFHAVDGSELLFFHSVDFLSDLSLHEGERLDQFFEVSIQGVDFASDHFLQIWIVSHNYFI